MYSRYQDWLTYVFDREDRDWYFEIGAPGFDASPTEITELVTETFLRSGDDLQKFTDKQVDQGIWYLAGSMLPASLFAIKAEEVPLTKRLHALESIFDLYANCFAKRCAETLGHLSEEGAPLNSSCYMFWDISPIIYLDGMPEKVEMEDIVLKTLEKTLNINHRACREAALHGLSEMVFVREQEAHRIIDHFLSQTRLDEKLLIYARNAREGNVL